MGSWEMILILRLKLGMSPFHFWFPRVIREIRWDGVLMLLTWQRVGLFGLVIITFADELVYFSFGIFSIIVGRLCGYNQLMIRRLLSYSSINHIGWIFMVVDLSELVMLIYFFIYLFMRVVVVWFLMNSRYVFLGQLMVVGINIGGFFVVIFIMMLSLGGLPPFLGFLSRWLRLIVLLR